MPHSEKQGIWLEVSDARFESEPQGLGHCEIRLKGDRDDPRNWWPVAAGVLHGKSPVETYRLILEEMDRKRNVIAELGVKAPESYLECQAFRFQSAESGSR